MLRIVRLLVLLLMALWVSPVVAFIVGGVLLLISRKPFYEIIILGILVDAAYATIISYLFIDMPLYTTIGIILYFASLFIRKRLSFHA